MIHAPTASPGRTAARRVRHEAKLILPAVHAPAALAWLEHACAPDPEFEQNVIHSLYFDTPHLGALHEKVQSEFLKCKVRARWYTDETETEFSSAVFLEIKRKEGARGFKSRRPLALDVAAFHRDPFARVPALRAAVEDAVEATVLAARIPICVVRYTRRRFLDMACGVHLALDSDIGTTHASERLPFRGPVSLAVAVLEVKGAGARGLPPVLYALQRFGLRKRSFSKYAECLNRLLEGGG